MSIKYNSKDTMFYLNGNVLLAISLYYSSYKILVF